MRGDWGVRGTPANFFIDREGELRDKSCGFAEEHVPNIERIIDRLLE